MALCSVAPSAPLWNSKIASFFSSQGIDLSLSTNETIALHSGNGGDLTTIRVSVMLSNTSAFFWISGDFLEGKKGVTCSITSTSILEKNTLVSKRAGVGVQITLNATRLLL